MNILVVEDEQHIAEILERALASLGNTCVVAQDSEEATRMLDEGPIDAVTLDLGIPGVPGLDWLEALAVNRPHLAHKTLVITGQLLEPESVRRVVRCGAGLLAKPFTLEHLGDAVRSQLDFSSNRAN